jgi:hypothetical protein
MADLWRDFTGTLDSLAGKWTGYAALGTFPLYLFGYLALRFQLYTYGVATNLDAFDEKYLFAGCSFLVFLAMWIPSILLLLTVVMAPLYWGYRIMPAWLRSRLRSTVSRWRSRPYLPLVGGCLLPLLLIQLVLRQCVLLSNMLLRERPPEFWISSVLLAGDIAQAFYFAGLLLGAGVSVAVLVYVRRVPPPPGTVSTLLTASMVLLVAVEFLLLPVNYGILIRGTSLPRVSQIENKEKLASGGSAWLVWESKETLTYLVCENNSRTMISIPKKDSRVAVTGYDDIFRAVGQPPCSMPK